MVKNDLRLKIVSKAAVYSYMHKKYKVSQRWFIAGQALLVVLALLLSIILQAYLQVKPPSYKLSDATYNLIGESRDDTRQYLKVNKEQTAFEFAVPKEMETGGKEHVGRVADIYEAKLPKLASEGVTYVDTQNKIDITLTPTFRTGEGKKVDGDHIVYTMGAQKLIYTLKYNGLKEDIVVPEYAGNELDYGFELSLPSGVEARLDEQGNIGIYSSDPTLFGNISFGSDEDRAKIDKAREKGDKNNLVATIPSPIVKDASGNEYNDKASFDLSEKSQKQTEELTTNQHLPAEVKEQLKSKTTKNVYSLKLGAKNLRDLVYPISIDPTIQTTSSSDFSNLNHEGGVELDNSTNLIRRSSLTGGYLNTWSTTGLAVLPAARYVVGTASYNGYIYVTGGENVGHHTTVYVSKVDSSGNLISPNLSGCAAAVWCTTSSLLVGRVTHGAVAYNGYLYVVGGHTTGITSSVEYAKINSDGSLGSFASTSSLTEVKQIGGGLTAYNGYLYAVGGCNNNCNTLLTTVERVQINANGTLGTWTTSGNTQLSSGTRNNQTLVYNGRLYSIGGNNGVNTNAVIVANINSDSTVGSWRILNSLIAGHSQGHAVAVVSGYIYVMGGCQEDTCNSRNNSTEYAPINADGSIGSWRSTAAFGDIWASGYTVVNNKIFSTGGCFNAASCSVITMVQGATIKPAGWTEAWTTQTNQYTNGRQLHSAVAYNGYLYVAGGCNGNCYSAGQTYYNDTQYAPINADGSLGTWGSGSSFGGSGRAGVGFTAYNGYLYVSGGFNVDGLGVHTNFNTSYRAAINATTGVPGAWTSLTNGIGTRAEHELIGYNGYLYSFGGRNGATVVDTVQYAPLSVSTGDTTSAFQATTVIPVNNARSSVVLAGDRFYIFGGCSSLVGSGSYTCNGEHDDIFYVTPNSNGTIGSWTTQTDGLNGAIYDYGTAAFVKGYFYVHGGDGGGSINFVKFAPLNTNGSVGSWTTTTSTLTWRSDQETLSYGDYFYIIGGNASRSIDRTQINNGGSGMNGASVQDSDKFSAESLHETVALNGFLYVVGGCAYTTNTCGGPTTAVQYATIANDGTVGAFANTTNGLTGVARQDFAAFTYGGRLYVIGGCTNAACNTYTDDAQYVTPNVNGNITVAWTTQTDALPSNGDAWIGFDVAVYDGYVYRAGGSINGTRSTTVQRASLDVGAGTIGTWGTTTALGTAVVYNQVVAYHGYLYSIGGATASGDLTTIQFAPIDNSTHNVGSWATTTQFVVARTSSFIAEAYNGYMYLTTGYSATGFSTQTVQVASILPNGQLGTWQKSANGLVQYANSASGTIYNGKLYITGGHNAVGTSQDDVEYMTLQSIPRTGSYSRLFDFGSSVRPTKLVTRGTKQNGTTVAVAHSSNISCNNTSLDNGQSTSDAGYTGANALSLSLGSSRTLARCLSLRYAIDDTQSAVFPDSGNETTITDFDVYFTSNPGKRLKGGRTFSNGTDNKLGTSP